MAADHTLGAGPTSAASAFVPHRLPVIALGLSLSGFFLISFLLCVLGYYLEGTLGLSLRIAHGALSLFLPGFEFGSWPRFLLGFVESLAWGWYIALILGPLYNFFTRTLSARR